jgi:hypothetical protein
VISAVPLSLPVEYVHCVKGTLPSVKGGRIFCESSELELLLDPKYAGKIYVSGIFVCNADRDARLEGIGVNYVGGKETYSSIHFGRCVKIVNINERVALGVIIDLCAL